ncbi:MAG: STAS domain-containing protein [Bacteroidales bacterium]|nr:MAG: anti-anti-sigma factor [bacterium P3]KWW38170.1 MAG: anti-anti-sigma factor [bacterium F083]MBQ1698988.1 STAS domain-containing protein [Bacteroidales bacterium]MBQ6045758.1 STAS domain-containing protein [Bacteroidales bacterium]MBQ6072631.1 STAS domain-containing protein [Bacteroidales bacterium]
METTIQEVDGKLVATLSGEFDTAAAIDAEQALKPLLESSGRDLAIDCSELEYISSSGLRIFLNILKNARSSGNKVTLLGVNEVIRDVLELTGLVKLFELE